MPSGMPSAGMNSGSGAPGANSGAGTAQPGGPGASGFLPPEQVPPQNLRRASAQEIYDDLKLRDEILSGSYANAVMIGHGPHEFSFDFITTSIRTQRSARGCSSPLDKLRDWPNHCAGPGTKFAIASNSRRVPMVYHRGSDHLSYQNFTERWQRHSSSIHYAREQLQHIRNRQQRQEAFATTGEHYA